MQCELCKVKAATVHLTEIIDGRRTESHLCQACAQKEGISIKSQLSLNELLSSLIAAHEQTDEQGAAEAEKSCPVCGMTMDMFRKQAVLGCPNDYEVFGKTLEQLIEKAHDGNLMHKGKIPAGVSQEEVSNTNKKEELKKQLDRAVAAEDYELAAKLRDQLKTMQ
ncbi:MAG: UvrB/UvrC motif-containing protein [Phycisphaerae bacterium]|nr:UvrB/UvrC motif-containing protein [Phycisphaerae bacterium]